MPTCNILGEINVFLQCDATTTLEIIFTSLEIDTYHNGKFLKKITKPNGRIRINKPQSSSLAKINVVDNIAFPFSFWFKKPTANLYYKSETLQLPRPLIQGSLEINAKKLVLQFVIDAPYKALQVKVKHTYTQKQFR
nr:hypothetical protein [uncultured Allomuricauda sp.]